MFYTTILCFLLFVTNSFLRVESKKDSLLEGNNFGIEKVVHTCCPLDLSIENSGRCKKLTPEDTSSSTSLTIPAHLMAENETNSFIIKIKRAMCKEVDVNTVTLNWNISSGRGSLFLKNGYLKVENEYYHMDEYCINGKSDTHLEISVCPQDCKGPRPCIMKCCGLHQVYSFGFSPNSLKKGCQNPGDNYFSPTLYKDFEHKSSNLSQTLGPHYIEKYPTSFKTQCHENKTTIILFPKTTQAISNVTNGAINITGHPFRIRSDGKILYREPDGKCAVIDPMSSNTCVDAVIDFGPEQEEFENDPNELVIFLCSLPPKEGETEQGGYFYGGLMIASSVFLLLTIAVYFALWERQTVHGWTILSHTISLFFMYIFLGIAHILRVTKGHSVLNTRGCYAVGLLCHFFFLSTFAWLSMISIDLWITFRAIIPRRGTKSKGFKRYSLYSVLGWGIPAIIVGVGLSLSKEHPNAEETCATVITPGYGIQSCYLQEKALGVYLYYPIAAMMGINILFFIVTSIKLYMYQQTTKMATKDETQQQFYRLFFKLFFVMGILYIFELVSWAVSGSGVFWYWAAFDVLNILRAVAVFIIFVIKSDILYQLEQNYPWLKPILIPFACITRKRHTFSQRHVETESVGLNSSLSSTKQTTLRSTMRSSSRMD